MNDAARTFAAWSDFYVIVGSSAAALTGWPFVVIVLANDSRTPATEQTVAAFSTPTIVLLDGASHVSHRRHAVARTLAHGRSSKYLWHRELPLRM